jgi:hypothetical protein
MGYWHQPTHDKLHQVLVVLHGKIVQLAHPNIETAIEIAL